MITDESLPAKSGSEDPLSKKLISKNLRTINRRGLFPLLGTLVTYKLLSMFIFLPALKSFWALVLRLSPVHYITNDTLFSILRIPYVPAAIFVIGVAAAFWALFEYSIIIIGLDHAFRAEKISIKALYISAFKEMNHAIKPGNLPILFFSAVLIPFTNIFMSSNYISQLVVPEYIMEVIRKNGIYNTLYILIFIGCVILSVMGIFVFHAFIIDGDSFLGAWRKSFGYLKKDTLKTLWTLFKKNALLTVKYMFAVIAVSVICVIALIYMGYNHPEAARSLGNAITLAEIPVLTYMLECMINIHQFAIISAIFYAKRGQTPAPSPDDRRSFKIGSGAFVAFTIIGNSALTLLLGYGIYMLPEDINLFSGGETTVSYHRGYCSVAPENTIPAFEAAIEDGCDVIELDVQLTKDDVVVVAHDPSLKRTAGIDKRIRDLTYDELRQIDVGSFFSDAFSRTRVPALEDVLKLCSGKTDLNIEIKQDGTQPKLEAETVRLIKQYDFTDHCTVTSLNYESLDKVKTMEPGIKTGYILAVGVGSYYDLPAADFFSVEASFITRGMVYEIHARGKTVSAWTINRREDAERLWSLGIDDMITEQPHMVKEVLEESSGLGDFISALISDVSDAADASDSSPFLTLQSEP